MHSKRSGAGMILSKPPFMAEADGFGKKKALMLEILIFAAVYMIASAAQSLIMAAPMATYISSMFADGSLAEMTERMFSGDFIGAMGMIKMPEYVVLTMLFSTVTLIAGAVMYCRLIEKRPLRTMGLVRGNILGEYAIGLGAGAAMAAVSVGICAAAGVMSIKGFSPHAGWIILMYFIGFMIQGMSEELLLRGYFMVSMARGRSLYPAVFISSAVFALMHILNPGITLMGMVNIFLFGVFAAVYVIKRGNLWGAAAMHTMWNFSLANILGIEVSGMEIKSSVFVTETSKAAEWLHGGAFGSEGGLGMTVVLAAGLVILCLIPSNKQKTAKHM